MLSIWIGCLALRFREPLKRVEIPSIKAACGWFIEAVLLTFRWTIGLVKALSAASFMVL